MTPNIGAPTCAMSTCSTIYAQVNCILTVLQSTTGDILIQFFDENQEPLDLDRFSKIQILLFDELGCGIVNFWWDSVPTGETGFLINIIQTTSGTGTFENKGLLSIHLSKDCTKISPGLIFAEILLTEFNPNESIIGIPCFQVAKILESKIYNNNETTCG